MLKAAIEKIQGMSFHVMERDGRVMVNQKMFPVEEPEPVLMTIHTLEGIVEYIGHEKMNPDDVLIHVEDYRTVWLKGRLYGPEKQRDAYILAEAYIIKHRFGEGLPLDTFLTYIQAGFVQDENTALLLRALGNIVDETSVEYADDGVTQQVTARTGITRREIVKLPNPIVLRPYRTFPDIEQPASPFVLRVNKQGEAIMCALHEADGGEWKNRAVEAIKEYYLSEEIYDGTHINVVG